MFPNALSKLKFPGTAHFSTNSQCLRTTNQVEWLKPQRPVEHKGRKNTRKGEMGKQDGPSIELGESFSGFPDNSNYRNVFIAKRTVDASYPNSVEISHTAYCDL